MRRFFCVVSYDGYDYYGYQRQNVAKPSIQKVIEDVLFTIVKEKTTIYGSGRTDRMVHALHQTFHFDSTTNMSPQSLVKAMNSLLPKDIYIVSCKNVSLDFHARFSVKKKVYLYKIANIKDYNPLNSRYVYYVKESLDIDKMISASKMLLGTHDYRNFTTNKEEEVKSFVKTIYDINFIYDNEILNVEFIGSGFMRYMVRMLMGALIVIGSGKKNVDYIEDLLDITKEKCSYKAKAYGLYLKEVIYD